MTKLVGTESNFDVDKAPHNADLVGSVGRGHHRRLTDRISIADEEITLHLKTELVQNRTAPLMSIQIDNFPMRKAILCFGSCLSLKKRAESGFYRYFVNSAMILRPMAGKRIMDVFLDGNSKLRVSSAPNVNVEIYSKLEKKLHGFCL